MSALEKIGLHYRASPKCRKIGLKELSNIRRNPLRFFQKLALESGGHKWLSIAGHRILFLNDATAIDQVFKGDAKTYHKGVYNEGVRPLLGHSVFLSEEELWNKQRRMTAPAFANKQFDTYLLQIDKAVDEMMQRWDRYIALGENIDVSKEMMLITLEIVFRTMFGQENCPASSTISKSLYTMLGLAEERIWKPLNLPMKLVLKKPKYARPLKILEDATASLARSDNGNNIDNFSNLLDMLISAHDDSAEDKKLLRDNIMSFLLAGHETTANALAWTFFELGKNAHARNRVVKESQTATENGTPLTFGEARSLHYIQAAFNETMRLYPPVWTMSREAQKSAHLTTESGEVISIPAATTIMLCAYTVHRREEYWQDPESYYPERFLTPDKDRPKCAWFPFGGGPRLCLGFRLAEMEASVIFTKVFSKYDLSLVPGQEIAPQPIITLRPSGPILFRAKKRAANTLAKATAKEPPVTASRCPFNHEAA